MARLEMIILCFHSHIIIISNNIDFKDYNFYDNKNELVNLNFKGNNIIQYKFNQIWFLLNLIIFSFSSQIKYWVIFTYINYKEFML